MGATRRAWPWPATVSRPSLVLDAGTGIRSLTELLGGSGCGGGGAERAATATDAPFAGTLLLSHLHWDHVEGLPFCTALDRPDARCDLLLPAQPDGTGPAAALARMMSPPNFPIGPDGLLGSWTFATLEPGTYQREGWVVTAAEIAHKGEPPSVIGSRATARLWPISPTTAPPPTGPVRTDGGNTRRPCWTWSAASTC